MTSLPGYPGAPAVVLYREQTTNSEAHATYDYERIKVLTEAGKKYANVEIPYTSYNGQWGWVASSRDVGDVIGRTIHPDGTISVFKGKPYIQTEEKSSEFYGNAKRQELVFTLPDVTVGSILEYRFATRISEDFYDAPNWIIQGDLYVKSAHFEWDSTLPYPIAWFPILPAGIQVEHHTSGGNLTGIHQIFTLSIKDVPPQIEEEYMPPIENYGYRVLFYFNRARSADDFWQTAGRNWFHEANSFTNPNSDLKAATQQIIAGASSDDEKLRKIYAAVEQLENTDYSREHERREDKANGLARLNHTSDILNNKQGNSTELTELFVGMARAAGINADLMLVPDRSRGFFIPTWLTLGQFSDVIAVANVDGKDKFFDPGERYCPYGHLAWEHSFVKGLRQQGNSVAFVETPGDNFAANVTTRTANLTMDASGHITGSIDISYAGAPAQRWHRIALNSDDESLKHDLRDSIEDLIPHSLVVKDITVSNLEDYEKPFHVTYTVDGAAGAWTGKRLILPADLFFAGAKATFPDAKRDLAVDFSYPSRMLDTVRVSFPASFSVEASPSPAKFSLPRMGVYGMDVASTATSFTTQREYDFGVFFVLPTEYPQLRTFYSQFEANDQQSIILKSTSNPADANTTPSGTSSGH